MEVIIIQEIYKTIMLPVKCSKNDLNYLYHCNKLSAEVWNLCLELDKKYKAISGKSIGLSDLQKQTKKCVPLHAKGIHHVVHKYLFARDSMWKSIKAKHKDSKKVKLPYKQKKYFVTGWDYQSIRVDYSKKYILLARSQYIDTNNKIRNQKPVKCFTKTIPHNIVEIELMFKNKLYLAVKYKEMPINYYQVESDNVAAIDLGEIHSITSIDNNGNAIIITGRKLRSIKFFRNKEYAKLRSKKDKSKKESRKWHKYNKAIKRLCTKTENRISDAVHKITKLYLNYCLQNNISTVYYGDLDSCTRNTTDRNVGKYIGQKLCQWNYGQIMLQLENKLSRYGIKLVKVGEYYTSKKCPVCGKLNKPNGRNYACECGYIMHRDVNGAINILNDNNTYNYKVTKYNNLKYLRIE